MSGDSPQNGWRGLLAALPAVGVTMVPRFTWPCALPAYAGLISSMGLAFLMKTTYLLPLTVVFLCVAVGSLAFRARRRRGNGPFALGVVAAVLLLASKFIFESNPPMYAGAGLLFAASLWNAWPRRSAKSDSAAPTESLYQIRSNENEV